MQLSTNGRLYQLPHVIITSDDIWDPTILDHYIDVENDIFHPSMDPMIDEEDYFSFDEYMNVIVLIMSVMYTIMHT